MEEGFGDRNTHHKIDQLAQKCQLLAKTVRGFQNDLDFLEKISEKNIIIADFESENTRQRILEWERTNANLSSECFKK